MAPHLIGNSILLAETTIEQTPTKSKPIENKIIPSKEIDIKKKTEKVYKHDLVWRNIVIFVYLHIGAIYGLYLAITACKISTVVFGFVYGFYSVISVTGGAHRLWAHKAYKATWQLKLFWMIGQTMAFQNCIHEWVRDHRVHHKYTDTDADPHNSKRGFFFSHIGWLLVRKQPDVKAKGQGIDLSDLEADGIVMWQKKYYMAIMPFFCFILPTLIPYLYFGESFSNAWYYTAIFRYVITVNGTWLINSAAHIWGDKPFDKDISPTDSMWVSVMSNGEGWHNYHHTFPWDYKAAELGNYYGNTTTLLIDIFAKLGWAFELKTVSFDMIKRRIQRTGDGTHEESKNPVLEPIINEVKEKKTLADGEEEALVWGWDDPLLGDEERKCVNIKHTKKIE